MIGGALNSSLPRPTLGPVDLLQFRHFLRRETSRFAVAGAFAFRQRIPQLGAGGFGVFEELGDFFRMFRGEIAGFGNVLIKVIEFEARLQILIWHRRAPVASFCPGEGAVAVRQDQLPLVFDDGMEFVRFVVDPVAVVRIFRALDTGDERE
jgi:hypothetical protein